jgi:hypothetical protein
MVIGLRSVKGVPKEEKVRRVVREVQLATVYWLLLTMTRGNPRKNGMRMLAGGWLPPERIPSYVDSSGMVWKNLHVIRFAREDQE